MSNGFSGIGTLNRPLTNQTSKVKSSFIGDCMNDDTGLKHLQDCSSDDLQERLLVAEVVMKKLFARNKELEDRNDGATRRSMDRSSLHDPQILAQPHKSEVSASPYIRNSLESPTKEARDDSELFLERKDSLIVASAHKKCPNCAHLQKELAGVESGLQGRIDDLQEKLNRAAGTKLECSNQTYRQFMEQRLQETLQEAKRHFCAYVQMRDTLN